MRGLAVSMVLLYHADLGFLPAGFLGVDIFFVLSGFLITSLVRRAVEDGTFSFTEFYFRRAKRLLPAAYVTFLLTALAAPFILNAQELQDFSRQVLGAVTFSANVVLLMQAGYFAGAAELKPLLHVWSLSIEEQYYLLLPAMLVFAPRRYWLPVGVILLFGSLGLCLFLQAVKPIATFYLLPTRAWELGLGSLAAIAPLRQTRWAGLFRAAFWPAVALLVLLPVFPTGLPHPGVDALIVCCATVVVILRQHPLLESAWWSRGLARIGDVSYSLYLAHWPPFAFLKNAVVGQVTLQQSLATLLLGVVLGYLLYRFVELPTRRLALRPSRRFALGVVSVSCAVLSMPVAMAAWSKAEGPDFTHIRRSNDGFAPECAFETRFEPLVACRNAEAPKTMVWGDSFAMHLVPGLAAVSDGGVVQATRGNCGPILDLAPLSDVFYLRPWAEACMDFNRSVMDYIARTPSIRVVVLSSVFHQYLRGEDSRNHWRTLGRVNGSLVERAASVDIATEAMRATIRSLHALGKEVVLVAPPPSSGFNIGACSERRAQGKLVIGAPLEDCSIPQDAFRSFHGRTLELIRRLEGEPGLHVLSFEGLLCAEQRCAAQLEGTFLYVDTGHLTREGAALLARKLDWAAALAKLR
ncbi:acyltransferase family protein [Zoogloea sp.]|uniref:acyltransferase family protein n=1 Tax=Zoogloea sp. TaxID=49181 RepID=UPI0031FDF2E8